MGAQRTYATIEQKYFWPDMYQSAYDYVSSRDVCQLVKRERQDGRPRCSYCR